MTPNPKALEAAAKVVNGCQFAGMTGEDIATAAITAYFASLKEQGLVREGFCYEEYNDDKTPSWNADTHFLNGDGNAFPVLIIRTESSNG